MKGSLPLKPVDIKDNFGFRAAVYSVNALYKRCGIETVKESEARMSISSLIRKSEPRKLSIVLREWYSDNIDQNELINHLETLPDKILSKDTTRYEVDNFVSDIEWSAIATTYRCCIAVKFIFSVENLVESPLLKDQHQKMGWKIAVPSPQIFGIRSEKSNGPATACVFIVCHDGRNARTFFPLIPSDQPIFNPGRAFNSISREKKPLFKAETLGKNSCSRKAIQIEGKYVSQDNAKAGNEDIRKETKQVSFFNGSKISNAATPVTCPSSPIAQRMSTISEDLMPSKTMQAALGHLANDIDPQKIGRSDISTYSKNIHEQKKKVLSDHRSTQELSQLSDASILFDRIYNGKSRKERERSSLEIYGRLYDGQE